MAKKTTFEEAMKRLDEIVERIESGSVPLEESIRYYEEGMRLGRMCREMLDEANQRITRLRDELDAGGEKR